jgi:hypothetical protein
VCLLLPEVLLLRLLLVVVTATVVVTALPLPLPLLRLLPSTTLSGRIHNNSNNEDNNVVDHSRPLGFLEQAFSQPITWVSFQPCSDTVYYRSNIHF